MGYSLDQLPRTGLALLLLLFAGAVPALGQTSEKKSSAGPKVPPARNATESVFRDLLTKPAPPPPGSFAVEIYPGVSVFRGYYLIDHSDTPDDDAPIEQLIRYWSLPFRSPESNSRKPSKTVVERLLAACETDPRPLPFLLQYFPDSKETVERVVTIYENAPSNDQLPDRWRPAVEEWLKFNSTMYLTDLVRLSAKVRDKDGWINNDQALKAIAKVSRVDAEPMLRALVEQNQPRAAALALTLLLKYAIEDHDSAAEEQYRTRLRQIGGDQAAPIKARAVAIDGLLSADWPGRDDWYRELFADETLLSAQEGSTTFSPLCVYLDREPDSAISILADLVKSRDRTIRRNAGNCLARTVFQDPRRETVLPILSWLSDPNWLELDGAVRSSFIRKLSQIDVPESVPGLIWILQNEESNRVAAAEALTRYKDPRAVPALTRVLSGKLDGYGRDKVIEALIDSGGIPEADQLRSVEAYAAMITTEAGRDEVTRYRDSDDEPLTLMVGIGKFLASKKEVAETLAQAVLSRAEDARKQEPDLAKALFEIARSWQVVAVDLDLIRRIGDGKADVELIENAIARRERLQKNAGLAIRSLLGNGGPAAGVATVLLEDIDQARNVLGSGDESAKLTLVVCARAIRLELPPRQVGALLPGKDKLLAYAAERYLLADDRPDARQVLWDNFPRRAFITGWRESRGYGDTEDESPIDRVEDKLQTEVLSGREAPLEVFALIGQNQDNPDVLRVFKDRAVYSNYLDASHYRERVITGEELTKFRSSVAAKRLTEIGPRMGFCHHGCPRFEFLALTREGGRRLLYQTDYDEVAPLFQLFAAIGEGAQTHYVLEKKIPGAEVLVGDPDVTVNDIWQDGDDLRVRIEHDKSNEDLANDAAEDKALEEDGQDWSSPAREAAKSRRRQRDRERTSWFYLRDEKVVEPAPWPIEVINFEETGLNIDEADFTADNNERIGAAVSGTSVFLAADSDPGGLWKKVGSAPAVRIGGKGSYRDPVATPGGDWLVAVGISNADDEPPDHFVRVNVKTGREFPIKLPEADELNTYAYLPNHRRVLIRRASDDSEKPIGPPSPEFYLLDPVTGNVRLVAGNFTPLMQVGHRMLQPSAVAGVYWAAVPNKDKNETQLGRYDTKDFSFHPVMMVPDLNFDSMSMWVDEAIGKVYIVYGGQLLRLPLTVAPSSAPAP
jgi:hypothetical protein